MLYKKITIGLLLFVSANVLFLDYVWLGQKNANLETQPIIPIKQLPIQRGDERFDQYIDLGLIDMKIKLATESLTQKIETLGKSNSTILASPTSQKSQSSSVREHYVPLGTGSTNSTEWQDLPGVEANVAPSNYGTITGFYFEAGLRVPTGSGQVFARIRNVTDNITLFESELSNEGTTGKLISSKNMPIPQTTKLYRVQLRSSLGADVLLDSARLKIFVN